MFTMENCFYLLISQAMRYLRDPAVHSRDKQRMKQELSSELVRRIEGPDWKGRSWWGKSSPRVGVAGPHQAPFSLVEHPALQPLALFPQGSPQLPCCWHPPLAPGQVHRSL